MDEFVPELTNLVDLLGTNGASKLLNVSTSSVRDWVAERRSCQNPTVFKRLGAITLVNQVLLEEMSKEELAGWWFASKNGDKSPAATFTEEQEEFEAERAEEQVQ